MRDHMEVCLGEITHDLNLWHGIATVEYESVCSSPSLKLKTLEIFYLKYKLQEKLHQMYNITLSDFQTKSWVYPIHYLSETNQKFLSKLSTSWSCIVRKGIYLKK